MKASQLILRLGISCALALSMTTPAMAEYPERPVTLVVPYSPGGATDSTARIVARALQDISGKAFVVENVPGAGTVIGSSKVARSPADGYTLLFGGLSANVLAPRIYQDTINFDPQKDFEPIGGVASQPFLLVVNENSKYTQLSELLEDAKAQPGVLNFGSPGVGSAPHLVSELFLHEAGIEATHVPYKGAAPAIAALIGGSIDFMLDTPTAPMPQIDGKKLRALGATTLDTATGLEGIATMDSQGLTGFQAQTWFALFAPGGTDEEILRTLNDWLNKALESEAVREAMATAYLYPNPGSREELEGFVDSERDRWTKLIESAGLEKK